MVPFSFHPTRPRLLAGRPSGRLVTWDLERGVETGSWRLPPHWSVAYSLEADRFAIALGQGTNSMVEVRDANTGAVLTSTPFPNTVLSVAWHPDGPHLLVPCNDGNVSLMDARDGTLRTLGQHKAQAVSGWIAPAGDFAFSSGWDNEINVWNLRNYQHELTTALGGIDLQFNHHRPQVAVLVERRRLQIFEFSGAAEGRELAGDLSFGTRSGRFSADGRWLAVPTIDGVGVWDLNRSAPAAARKDAGLGGVFFPTDSDEMIGWSEDELFRWRLTPSQRDTAPPRLEPLPIFALKAAPVLRPKQYIHSAHLVAGDSTLLLALGDGLRRVPLTNLANGMGQFQKAPVWRSVISADERWLATSLPAQSTVIIYRLPDMQLERWLTNAAPVRGLAFSPQDGAPAVLTDTSLSLWSTSDWQVKRTRPVAADSFGCIAFSLDGQTLFLTESARVGALLSAATLESQLPLPAWMQPLALTPDGRFLAVGVESRRVQLWDLRAVRARFRELGVDWEP